ncbi:MULTISPECIES: aldehyde dehydrogenase [unclassified Pseudonocardia]|uniref:aldehyde dehydrogenase n=1 Tax=unclassified Pseudonocardia TaxID=2619320 RepID=UPI0001FFE9CC|nr:aldehyde dehydrogenase [Pseudonocardia sp. Ae707_Ps1]OLM09028.1 Aldehyde dehydrogenase [Pseudonocardia sp. Ae707_Ps1]
MHNEREHLYIDGGWRPGSGASITVINPATEQPWGWSAGAGRTDIDSAVDSARCALRSPAWAGLEPQDRAALMERFAQALAARGDDTAAVVTAENGMPIALSRVAEGQGPAATLRYYAQLCRSTPVEERRRAVGGRGTTVVRREPIGVVAAIVPWNFPQSLTMFKVAPALAAGCTVVLKPAPETALDAFAIADAAEAAGLPPGVVTVVPGEREVGEYLVAHPGVDKVAFTGSTAAGRAIGEVCGRLLRPVTLELGGKSAAIVVDDADLGAVARGLSWASLLNNGQTCYLSTRILAPRSRYGEIVDTVADLASSMRVGDPADEGTRIGPVVSQRQRDRVEEFIASGRVEGRIVTGGGRPAGLSRGWFVEPTVVADLEPHAVIAREEVFGPVLAVLAYDSLDDAVRLANDSQYGLGGTVWTADEERGLDLARRIETGSVGVNVFDLDIGSPFGGVKASGLGRELGPEGLAAYVSYKSIYTRGR